MIAYLALSIDPILKLDCEDILKRLLITIRLGMHFATPSMPKAVAM
jgi:hypothetical protein